MICKYEHDGDCCNSGAKQYMCKCKKPCNTMMPITNADLIRGMSNDDLAYWIMCPYDSSFCEGTDHNCIECTKEWLQQPAEELK